MYLWFYLGEEVKELNYIEGMENGDIYVVAVAYGDINIINTGPERFRDHKSQQ